jgi:hypothetical protein
LPKTPYISVAAVRPLETALRREIGRYQHSTRERDLGYCSEKKLGDYADFVERLLNNNASGYFYLHEDHEFGFPEPMVAFLSLSVAVKTDFHYDKCVRARVLQLKPEFQAKLGWLAGHMYSRVATQDWHEHEAPEAFDARLNEVRDRLGVLWCSNRLMEKIEKAAKRIRPGQLSHEEVVGIVSAHVEQEERKKDRVIQRVFEVLRELEIAEPTRDEVKQVLEQDEVLTGIFR